MAHQCDIVTVEPVTLAVTDAQTKQAEIPSRIPPMFDIVYAWLRDSGAQQAGHNYVVYDRFGADGMRMRVGVPVSKAFDDTAQVKCLRLTGGRAAHTTVVGPYTGISAAHMDLNAWCAQHKHALAGLSWEVYGDWVDDESKLVTDVYFRLA
jgi:effector-binding domain-containing protein